MSEQLVPASPVVEQHSQPGSRYVCVGLDALSAADELVEGVSTDLQQVIAKMKQAAHVKYTPGVKFGTDNKAVLHTYIQVHCSAVYLYTDSDDATDVWTCMDIASVKIMLHATIHVGLTEFYNIRVSCATLT